MTFDLVIFLRIILVALSIFFAGFALFVFSIGGKSQTKKPYLIVAFLAATLAIVIFASAFAIGGNP